MTDLPTQHRLAMLIDGDNAQATLIGHILTETSKYGLVTIRRIYGDWTEANMKSWKQALHTYAIMPIQQFRYTAGKNATDSAMIIDAMDILYSGAVDGFCLVSSDSDYTRLATRIREKNLFVMGIGKQTTPRAFVNACDVFVYTENLAGEDDAPALEGGRSASGRAPAKNAAAAGEPPDLKALFRTAFELSVGENGWAFLSDFGNRLRQIDPGFDPRTYGHRQLLRLVQAHSDWIDIRKVKGKSSTTIHVRLKQEK